MERKGSQGFPAAGATVTSIASTDIRAALPKSRTLTSEEEKALRMRHGVKQDDAHAPLPRAAGSNAELADELLVIEMQLMKAYRARARASAVAAARPVLDPAGAKAKDRIVRALRKKK